jgi:hypothetical protein
MFARISFRKDVSGRCLFYWLYGIQIIQEVIIEESAENGTRIWR